MDEHRAELEAAVVEETPQQPVVALDARGNLVAFTRPVKRCPPIHGSGGAHSRTKAWIFNRGRKSL